jgi:peroxiredoxin
MNFLKSAFVMTYMTLLMGLTGYAGWMLTQTAQPLAWTGVMLTTAPFLLTLGWIMLRSIARTSAHLPSLIAAGGAGLALAVWSWRTQGAEPLAPLLAAVGWAGFLVYAYWYSSFGRKPSARIKAGAQLPGFSVRDVNGAPVSSAKLTDRPAILIFYRGNWCPLCMAQIKELAQRYREIGALGVRVALISPQPHSNTVALAKKYGVTFDFLTDKGNAAAHALGIAIPFGIPLGMQVFGYDSETVMPTVIVTDHHGRVVWVHETDNYRIRPEPDTYIEVLRRNGLIAAA